MGKVCSENITLRQSFFFSKQKEGKRDLRLGKTKQKMQLIACVVRIFTDVALLIVKNDIAIHLQ